MPYPIPPDVWARRSAAMSDRIEQAVVRLADDPPAAPYGAILDMGAILKQLDGFHKRMMGFFVDGFYTSGELEPSALFPPEYVLEQILLQVGFDLNAVSQIHDQRMGVTQGPEELRQPAIFALARGDCLAAAALYPARAAGILDSNVAALSYYQKSIRIRVMPYAPACLISMPYSVTLAERDYLALPHEAGHYVYRHGSLDGKRPIYMELEDAFADEPDWVRPWIEELFSDIYGTIIGGPAVALSFQDLQMAETGADFVHSDGVHPTPIVRSHIFHKVIEAANPRLAPYATLLRLRWEAILAQMGVGGRGESGDMTQGPRTRDAQGDPTDGPRTRDAQGGASLTRGPSSFAAQMEAIELSDGTLVAVEDAISTGSGFDIGKPLDRMIAVILDRLGDLDVPAIWRGYAAVVSADAQGIHDAALAGAALPVDSVLSAGESVYQAFERSVAGLDPYAKPDFPVPAAITMPRRSSFDGLMAVTLSDYKAGLDNEPDWVSLYLAGGWTKGPRGRDDAQRLAALTYGPRGRHAQGDDTQGPHGRHAQGNNEPTSGPRTRDAQGDDTKGPRTRD